MDNVYCYCDCGDMYIFTDDATPRVEGAQAPCHSAVIFLSFDDEWSAEQKASGGGWEASCFRVCMCAYQWERTSWSIFSEWGNYIDTYMPLSILRVRIRSVVSRSRALVSIFNLYCPLSFTRTFNWAGDIHPPPSYDLNICRKENKGRNRDVDCDLICEANLIYSEVCTEGNKDGREKDRIIGVLLMESIWH